jgi:hypothetical protein
MAYRMGRRSRRGYSRYRSAGYGRFRSAYKSGGGSLIFGIGGVAAGWLAPNVFPMQDMIITAIAVLPGVMPMGKTLPWQLRRFASGYVIGRIAQGFIANPLGANSNTLVI